MSNDPILAKIAKLQGFLSLYILTSLTFYVFFEMSLKCSFFSFTDCSQEQPASPPPEAILAAQKLFADQII